MWRLRHYVTLASSRRVGPLPGIWVQGLRAGKNIFLFFILFYFNQKNIKISNFLEEFFKKVDFFKKIRKICREIFQKLKILGFKRNTGVGFGAFRVTWKPSGHWDFIYLDSCRFMLIGMSPGLQAFSRSNPRGPERLARRVVRVLLLLIESPRPGVHSG